MNVIVSLALGGIGTGGELRSGKLAGRCFEGRRFLCVE
jgi:hypothetical protein